MLLHGLRLDQEDLKAHRKSTPYAAQIAADHAASKSSRAWIKNFSLLN